MVAQEWEAMNARILVGGALLLIMAAVPTAAAEPIQVAPDEDLPVPVEFAGDGAHLVAVPLPGLLCDLIWHEHYNEPWPGGIPVSTTPRSGGLGVFIYTSSGGGYDEDGVCIIGVG